MAKVATLPSGIDRLVNEIREHMEASLDQRLQAAIKLVELRQRIEVNGENWWTWFKANEHRFVHGRRECQRLLKVGNSPDPAEAMEAEREKTRKAVAKHRDLRKSQVEMDETLADWMAEAGPYPTCGYEVNNDPDRDLVACHRRGILHMSAEAAAATEHWHFKDVLEHPDEIDSDIIQSCEAAAEAWCDLLARLKQRGRA